MKIYIDIIFLENLCMNYIILYATGIAMKKQIKHVKLIIASIIGSIYAIIIYLKMTNIASNIIMKIILSICMIWVSFKSPNYKILLKDLLMFYLVSFVFGGCSFALIYFISPQNVKIKNGVLVGTYPIKVTLIASIIAFIVIQIAFKITKNKLTSEDMICKIELNMNQKTLKTRALIDSGNMLKDPLQGNPVIIIEKEKMAKLLSEELLKTINKIQKNDLRDITYNDKTSLIRLIPFSSLGKTNGMLVGIKAKEIKVTYKDEEKNIENIIIGIYDKKISKFNEYNALIGLDLLGGGESELIKVN